MKKRHTITDMLVFPVLDLGKHTKLLSESDQLLRRFGQLDLVTFGAREEKEFPARNEADEIWFILEGKMEIHLKDQREGSPSQGKEDQVVMDAEEPAGLLLPFGVVSSFSSEEGARMLRLSTHLENPA